MLTIGFSAGPGLFDWHFHFLDEPIDEAIEKASSLIDEIISGRVALIYSSVLGYFPGDAEDMEGNMKYREPDEIIELRYWRDL
ncbi:MAG TPA: hypothetical protein VHC96_09035 [Puia sp.]|jgi:hypothetical protein|nr:hypothetical protein [Puia sp.]